MNPKVSIIIPVKEINDYIRESIPKILKLDYDNFDIIVHVDVPTQAHWPKTRIIIGQTKNETPPVKRELAIKASDAPIIAFLDDDASPHRDWLKNAVRHFNHPDIGAVYGPGVTPASDGFWAKVSGEVLSSPLTSWKYTYRYVPADKYFRERSRLNCEKCSVAPSCDAKAKIFTVDDAPTVNLLIRREVFDRAGGFNTKYWPGEDTKLCLDVVLKQKRKIVYDADVLVWHHRRDSLYKHFQQNGRYAIHRGFFAKRFPKTSLRWQYFVPSIFILFVAASIWYLFARPGPSWLAWGLFAVWLLYLLFLIQSGLTSAWRQRNAMIGLAVIPIIFVTHLVYGVGLVVGLLAPELKR